MTKIISEYTEYKIDEYPRTCKECPFLQKRPYKDNAYTGVYYLCDLNYMDHGDTREFDVLRRRWKDCAIENDKRVNVPFVKKPEKERIAMANVLYLCDRKACKKCSFPRCCHTTDIHHATNFSMVSGYCDGEKPEYRIFYLEDDSHPDCAIELERINDILGPVGW